MKVISYFTAGLVLAILVASTSSAEVAMMVGEPGFFGAISVGNGPQPVLLNSQPIIIQPAPVQVAPLYLRVRPNEQKNWRRYCGYYNACNRPVYFVDHNWYQRAYVPYYKSHRRDYDRHDNRRGYDRPDYGRGHGPDPHDYGRGHGPDPHDYGRDHGLDPRANWNPNQR